MRHYFLPVAHDIELTQTHCVIINIFPFPHDQKQFSASSISAALNRMCGDYFSGQWRVVEGNNHFSLSYQLTNPLSNNDSEYSLRIWCEALLSFSHCFLFPDLYRQLSLTNTPPLGQVFRFSNTQAREVTTPITATRIFPLSNNGDTSYQFCDDTDQQMESDIDLCNKTHRFLATTTEYLRSLPAENIAAVNVHLGNVRSALTQWDVGNISQQLTQLVIALWRAGELGCHRKESDAFSLINRCARSPDLIGKALRLSTIYRHYLHSKGEKTSAVLIALPANMAASSASASIHTQMAVDDCFAYQIESGHKPRSEVRFTFAFRQHAAAEKFHEQFTERVQPHYRQQWRLWPIESAEKNISCVRCSYSSDQLQQLAVNRGGDFLFFLDQLLLSKTLYESMCREAFEALAEKFTIPFFATVMKSDRLSAMTKSGNILQVRCDQTDLTTVEFRHERYQDLETYLREESSREKNSQIDVSDLRIASTNGNFSSTNVAELLLGMPANWFFNNTMSSTFFIKAKSTTEITRMRRWLAQHTQSPIMIKSADLPLPHHQNWPDQRGVADYRRLHEVQTTLTLRDRLDTYLRDIPATDKPIVVIDIGAGRGQFAADMRKRCRNAIIVAIGMTPMDINHFPTDSGTSVIAYQQIPRDHDVYQVFAGCADVVVDTFGALTYASNPIHAFLYAISLLKPNGRFSSIFSGKPSLIDASPMGSASTRMALKKFTHDYFGTEPTLQLTKVVSKVTPGMIVDDWFIAFTATPVRSAKAYQMSLTQLLEAADNILGKPIPIADSSVFGDYNQFAIQMNDYRPR